MLVVSSLSFTPSKYLVARVVIFSLFLIFCRCSTVIVEVSSSSPYSAVFGSVDPNFVGLIAAFDWVFSFIFFKFLFEEFVDVIFPSFSWSSNRSVGTVS